MRLCSSCDGEPDLVAGRVLNLLLEVDEPGDDIRLVGRDHDRQLALGDLLPPSSLVGRLAAQQLPQRSDLRRYTRLGSLVTD